ncbi:MAG TPA: TonB-dependent receptor [Croceicoccus sp.]|nr:TonB-dependent receptor [Croceicoccus sp.]
MPQTDDAAPFHEIVVTGERIARTQSDTASSVTVLTGERIEQTTADRLDAILALVPNVQLGSGEEGPAIRGLDSTGQLRNLFAFLGGARPRVTLTVDGRAVSFYEFVSGSQSAWDIAQVEVFRSPQTTTQGRNSIAGAIFITTRAPSGDWEGRVRTIAAEHDLRQLSAMLSGPVLGEDLAMRISGDLRLARTASEMVDAIPGADIRRDEYGTGRIKLLYRPAALPDAFVETTFAHTRSQSPQFEGIDAPFRQRRLVVPNQMVGVMKVEATSLTARAGYALPGGVDAALILSWGDATLNRFGLPGLGRAHVDARDFAIEPTLTWKRSDALTVLVGAHRGTSRQAQTLDITRFGIGLGTFDDDQDSLGLFGQAAWRPAPAIMLTAGVRYQRDSQRRTGQLGSIPIDYDRNYDAWLPKVTLSYDLSDRITAGVMVQRAYNPGGVTISFRRGDTDTFEPESLWNYEGFVRIASADGRTRLSANVFYNDIRNAQRPQTFLLPLPGGGETEVVEFANAPAARIYGLEAELDWRPDDALDLRLAAGLLDTKVTRALNPEDPTLGRDFERSPGFSAAGSVAWRPAEGLQLSSQVRHQSGYFSDDKNSPALRIGSSTVVDARAAQDIGPLTVFAYASNLFDAFYMTYLVNPSFGSAGKPREIGAGLEARF